MMLSTIHRWTDDYNDYMATPDQHPTYHTIPQVFLSFVLFIFLDSIPSVSRTSGKIYNTLLAKIGNLATSYIRCCLYFELFNFHQELSKRDCILEQTWRSNMNGAKFCFNLHFYRFLLWILHFLPWDVKEKWCILEQTWVLALQYEGSKVLCTLSAFLPSTPKVISWNRDLHMCKSEIVDSSQDILLN